MMKNRSLSLISLLLITIFAYIFQFQAENAAALAASSKSAAWDIVKQLNEAGAVMEEIRLDGWAKVNEGYMSLFDLQKQADKICYASYEDTEAKVYSNETADIRQVSLFISQDDIKTNIIFYNCTISHDKEDNWETYIIINTILDSDRIWKENQAYQKIQQILSRFEDSPSVGTTYTAVIPERLAAIKMEQLGRKLIKSLQGRITECSRDSDWISFTGYSNSLGGGIESEYGKFNVNVALRYHSSEGKTYIRIGTPIIAIPY